MACCTAGAIGLRGCAEARGAIVGREGSVAEGFGRTTGGDGNAGITLESAEEFVVWLVVGVFDGAGFVNPLANVDVAAARTAAGGTWRECPSECGGEFDTFWLPTWFSTGSMDFGSVVAIVTFGLTTFAAGDGEVMLGSELVSSPLGCGLSGDCKPRRLSRATDGPTGVAFGIAEELTKECCIAPD